MSTDVLLRLASLAVGYAFGMVQTAFILGKVHRGIDIRDYGSGNSGTTNAMRVMGKKAGFLTLCGDMLKGALAIWIAALLFGRIRPDIAWLLKVYAFAGAVIGHDYPFYMGFKGGKGVAVLAGFCLAFHWTYPPVQIAVFLIPFLITHFVSLGSLCVYAAIVVQTVIEGQLGVFGDTPQAARIEMYVILAALASLAWWRHRANIVRLANGTENRTYL